MKTPSTETKSPKKDNPELNWPPSKTKSKQNDDHNQEETNENGHYNPKVAFRGDGDEDMGDDDEADTQSQSEDKECGGEGDDGNGDDSENDDENGNDEDQVHHNHKDDDDTTDEESMMAEVEPDDPLHHLNTEDDVDAVTMDIVDELTMHNAKRRRVQYISSERKDEQLVPISQCMSNLRRDNKDLEYGKMCKMFQEQSFQWDAQFRKKPVYRHTLEEEEYGVEISKLEACISELESDRKSSKNPITKRTLTQSIWDSKDLLNKYKQEQLELKLMNSGEIVQMRFVDKRTTKFGMKDNGYFVVQLKNGKKAEVSQRFAKACFHKEFLLHVATLGVKFDGVFVAVPNELVVKHDNRQISCLRYTESDKYGKRCKPRWIARFSDGSKPVDVAQAWVEENFDKNYITQCVVQSRKNGQMVNVPIGKKRNDTNHPSIEVHEGLPEISHGQGKKDLCLTHSLASCYFWLTNDLVMANQISREWRKREESRDQFGQFLCQLKTILPKGQIPLLLDLNAYHPLTSVSPHPTMVVLEGMDGSVNHAVSISGHWLFDSNLEKAQHLSQWILDWCVDGKCKGAHRAARIVPQICLANSDNNKRPNFGKMPHSAMACCLELLGFHDLATKSHHVGQTIWKNKLQSNVKMGRVCFDEIMHVTNGNRIWKKNSSWTKMSGFNDIDWSSHNFHLIQTLSEESKDLQHVCVYHGMQFVGDGTPVTWTDSDRIQSGKQFCCGKVMKVKNGLLDELKKQCALVGWL